MDTGKKIHSVRVYFIIFSTRFECILYIIFSTRFECSLVFEFYGRLTVVSHKKKEGGELELHYNVKQHSKRVENMQNNTRNGWRTCKTTLETGGEHAKPHSKRVENMKN